MTIPFWFEEQLENHLGRAVRNACTARVHERHSAFQKIEVFDTIPFGRMLVHDGAIMLTEFDEAHYHEMISHVPLNVHPDPRDVLIIGGGDGGTVREVLRHPSVRHVDLCEIDREVVEVAQAYFPDLAQGLRDPRVHHRYEDGAAFVANHPDQYDVIIVDSSDPIGPAEVLFQEAFFRNIHRALRPGGIATTQSESYLYHNDLIRHLAGFCREIFAHYAYYHAQVPTYPSGTIGFGFCSRGPAPLDIQPGRAESLGRLRYYSPQVHQAAFVLPPALLQHLS